MGEDIVALTITTPTGKSLPLKLWLDFSMNRSITRLVNTARVSVIWDFPVNWGLFVGSTATISIFPKNRSVHFETLMTGYITNIERVYTSEKERVILTIKDKTVDLEQCTPVTEQVPGFDDTSKITPSSFGEGIYLQEIVNALCKPFGISVMDQSFRQGSFDNTTISIQETVWSQIQKLCTQTAVTAYTDTQSRLVIDNFLYTHRTREQGPYKDVDSYAIGVSRKKRGPRYDPFARTVTSTAHRDILTIDHTNTLQVTQTTGFDKRFSDYIVINSDGEALGEEFGPEEASEAGTVISSAKDTYIKRHRPITVQASDSKFQGDINQFPDWLKQINRGDSVGFTAELDEWYQMVQRDGRQVIQLFTSGQVVSVNLPKWDYKGKFVISGADFSLNDSKRSLSVSLVPLDLFLPMPQEEKSVQYQWVYEGDPDREIEKMKGGE